MRLVIVLFAVLSAANAAKILLVSQFIAHSHFTLGYALAKGLADKGHDVTFVTPFEEKESVKNIKWIFLSHVNEIRKGKGILL